MGLQVEVVVNKHAKISIHRFGWRAFILVVKIVQFATHNWLQTNSCNLNMISIGCKREWKNISRIRLLGLRAKTVVCDKCFRFRWLFIDDFNCRQFKVEATQPPYPSLPRWQYSFNRKQEEKYPQGKRKLTHANK